MSMENTNNDNPKTISTDSTTSCKNNTHYNEYYYYDDTPEVYTWYDEYIYFYDDIRKENKVNQIRKSIMKENKKYRRNRTNH